MSCLTVGGGAVWVGPGQTPTGILTFPGLLRPPQTGPRRPPCLFPGRETQAHLEWDLQVDHLSHLAEVGLAEVAGHADLGGLCIE